MNFVLNLGGSLNSKLVPIIKSLGHEITEEWPPDATSIVLVEYFLGEPAIFYELKRLGRLSRTIAVSEHWDPFQVTTDLGIRLIQLYSVWDLKDKNFEAIVTLIRVVCFNLSGETKP